MQAIITLLLFAGVFYRSWVLMVLWNWFPSHLLDLNQITFVGAMGLVVFFGFFSRIKKEDKEKTEEEQLIDISKRYFYHLFVLALGFIVQAFM